MTRIENHFELAAPLDDAALARLAEARSVYGILRIMPENQLRLAVEYDATRLQEGEVRGLLARSGVRIK